MSKAPPWYKRNPSDWQKGTRAAGMSFELRGFYSECLDAMWELQGQLPKDDKILAMMLGTNARLVRSLMPKLIALGKFIETAVGYYNPRMMADIMGLERVAQSGPFAPVPKPTEARTEVEPISTEVRTEIEPTSKIQKNTEKTTRDLDSDSEREREKEQHSYCLPPLPCDPKELSGKLVAAANGSIANPAAFPNLISMSTPIMWIEQGCDLDRDVLPTISAIGTKQHGKGIRSWDYFTSAISEAKARREKGLPPPPHLAPPKPFRPSRW